MNNKRYDIWWKLKWNNKSLEGNIYLNIPKKLL